MSLEGIINDGKKISKLPSSNEYIASINLSNPPAYGFFVVTSDLDLDSGNFVSNISFSPTLKNNGTFTVKMYDKNDNIVESRTYYSDSNASIQTRNGYGIPTQYGVLTKWSIEADSAEKPITALNFQSKPGMSALSFGDNYFDAFTTLTSAFASNKSLLKVVFPSIMNTITDFSSAFSQCYQLETLIMPTSMSACTTFANAFSYCKMAKIITFPAITGAVTSLANMCMGCESLTNFVLPETMDNVTTMAYCFHNCYKLTSVTLPTSMNALTTLSACFKFCERLPSVNLPATLNNLTTMADCFQRCYKLTSVTLPTSSTAIVSLNNTFNGCNNMLVVPEFASIGTNQIDMTTVYLGYNATAFDQSSARASKLSIGGASATAPSILESIEIDWANSTYGGASPQIDLRFNNLSAAEIDRIFTALPTIAMTINVAGNPGAATCTTSIATTKTLTVITS